MKHSLLSPFCHEIVRPKSSTLLYDYNMDKIYLQPVHTDRTDHAAGVPNKYLEQKNSGNRCLSTVYRNILRFLFILLLRFSRPTLACGGQCRFLRRCFLTALRRFYNHKAFPTLRQSSSGNSGRFCPGRWCLFER